jgi:F-type H+-transporting ATPase subunit delta
MSVTSSYADAIHSIASAEGDIANTRAELQAFSQAMQNNTELRSTLANALLPADTRNGIVDDLLKGKASNVTRSIVGLIVNAGRAGDFSEIVNQFMAKAATSSGKRLAVVRSAVPLSAEQQARLANALAKQAGGPVELHTEIDPSVVGGVVTTLGDTVIDGTVRSRINKMREAL